MAEEEAKQGLFRDTLNRTNKSIKQDRADSITEDAQIAFGRQVEDIKVAIKRKNRERNNMLDLSPTNSMSLMVANEFDAITFVEKDNALGLEIRNLEIKYEIANNRYNQLFEGAE